VFSGGEADLLHAIADNYGLVTGYKKCRHYMVIHHSPRVPEHRNGVRGFIAAVLACASLVGCASTSDVVAADKPGTYTVAASATGGRMAWARAHEHAVSEARDYCERRGMQSSVMMETVSGVQTMSAHGSSVSFECHPKF
jgi:hypothetical protein